MDGLTLNHKQDDDPHCSVVFGGGRLGDNGQVDDRRIEIKFSSAYFARISPKGDDEDIEALGLNVLERYDGPWEDYLGWMRRNWRETGVCPAPGFYVATESLWLRSVQGQLRGATDLKHYLLFGRDSYIELLATGFSWREWIWAHGSREQFTNPVAVVGAGCGTVLP